MNFKNSPSGLNSTYMYSVHRALYYGGWVRALHVNENSAGKF